MLRLLPLLLLLLLLPVRSSSQDLTLSFMAYEGPPYYTRDADGQWGGMNVELVRALADRAGLTLKPLEYPWNRSLMSLENGQLDMMVELSRTPERERFTHFLGVSFHEQFVLIVRTDQAEELRKSLLQLDDLARPGYLWGTREKVFYSEEFNARLRTDLEFASHFDAVSYTKVNLDRLKIGRLTGVFGYLHPVNYLITHDPSYRDLTFIRVPFFPPSPNYFGVSRKIAPEKLERLQRAYAALADEGVFTAIEMKWAPAAGE